MLYLLHWSQSKSTKLDLIMSMSLLDQNPLFAPHCSQNKIPIPYTDIRPFWIFLLPSLLPFWWQPQLSHWSEEPWLMSLSDFPRSVHTVPPLLGLSSSQSLTNSSFLSTQVKHQHPGYLRLQHSYARSSFGTLGGTHCSDFLVFLTQLWASWRQKPHLIPPGL